MSSKQLHSDYWKRNLQIVSILLGVWFLVSFGASVLFVDQLDQVRVAGFKFGFWMAQQGAIYVFVSLIFIYVYCMAKLDKAHKVHDTEDQEYDI
ncbi:MAG: DUF4212 domain-containing protein [Verrucomicrobiota bacterium]